MRRACTLFACVALVAGEALAAGAAGPRRDEGSIRDLAVSPSPFSPAFSPKKMDTTWVGGTLTRQMPVWLRCLRSGEVVWTGRPADVRNRIGAVARRFEWTGVADNRDTLPDGKYVIEARTNVRLNWRLGDPRAGSDGLIVNPHALAVDAAGNLYVATKGDVIQVFDPDGRFVRSFGPRIEGLKTGVLRICAMAFAGNGKLFVLRRHDIVLLDPDGSRGRVFAPIPDERGWADERDGLAVDRDGRVIVGCASQSRILIFNGSNGRLAATIGTAGIADGQFTHLADVTVGPGDRIYAADLPQGVGRVQVFDRDGRFVRSIRSGLGEGALPVHVPQCLGVLSTGALVVTEGVPQRGRPMIAYLRPDDRLDTHWGTYGSDDGQFASISRLVVHGDHGYAADHTENHRVVRFKAGGFIVRTYRTAPGRIVRPTGIAKISADRYVIGDGDLERCTVIGSDGSAVRSWPLWELDSRVPVRHFTGPFEGPPGQVILAQGERLYFVDEFGTLKRTITLSQALHVAGLLYEVKLGPRPDRPDPRETGRPGAPRPGDAHAVRERISITGIGTAQDNAILVFDGTGRLIQRIGGGRSPFFFGPIGRGKEGRLLVQQYLFADPANPRWSVYAKIAVSEIEVGEKAGLRQTVALTGTTLRSGESTAPAPFVFGGTRLLRGGQEVDCFRADGKFLWSLGSMAGKPLKPAAMLLDGNRLVCVNAGTGHVESWSIADDVPLATAPVVIDNTPPAVAFTDAGAPLTGRRDRITVRGTITDAHFDRYQVSYRYSDPTHPLGRSPWSRVQARPVKVLTPERPGGPCILADWPTNRRTRNRNIEVKVVAWDQAGNSTKDGATLVFDADNDGLTDEEEVALGTDPYTETQRSNAPPIIQPEIELLLAPYVFNNHLHAMTFKAYDTSDTPALRRLDQPTYTVFADAGSFPGGDTVDSGATAVFPAGVVRWQSPDADTRDVTLLVTFPRQGIGNVLYEAASITVPLTVIRDDDRDWLPDANELAAEDETNENRGYYPLRGHPDSDGDGVLDGFDLAPRKAFGADAWSSIYPPGAMRRVVPLRLYGIGGAGSFVEKRGQRVSNIYLARSNVSDAEHVKNYVNKTMFGREEQDPNKRSPFAVTNVRTLVPPMTRQHIRDVRWAETTLHPEYLFRYYADERLVDVVIDNVDTIDGTRFKDAGIHRNYLKVAAPGNPEFVDRRLTIQWLLKGTDRTSSPEEEVDSTRFCRMAWLVEVFMQDTLMGNDLLFSKTVFARRVDDRLFDAILDIPANSVYQRRHLYIKLTPYWMERKGGLRTCQFCTGGIRSDSKYDACRQCRRPLEGRYWYSPVDCRNLSVSGVRVEQSGVCTQWIIRLTPRNGQPMNQDVLAAVRQRTAAAFTTGGQAWPPVDRFEGYGNLQVDGHGYNVKVCSIAGLGRSDWATDPTWRPLRPSQRAAAVKARANQLAYALATSDVVCLVANDPRQLRDLRDQVNWGEAGTWWMPDATGEDADAADTPAGAATRPAAGIDGPDVADAAEADAASWKDVAKVGFSVLQMGIKTYATYSYAADWLGQRPLFDLPVGQPTRLDPVHITGVDAFTKKPITADRTITVTPCYPDEARFPSLKALAQERRFTITSRTVVERPAVTYQPATARRPIVMRDITHAEVEMEVEICHPNDSRILAKARQLDDTQAAKFSARLDKAVLGLKAGATVATNGYKIYQCYTHDDYAGIAFYTVKMGGELGLLAAEAKFGSRGLIKGLTLGKTCGARVNVVAVAIGVIEIGYNTWLWHKADTPVAKQSAASNTFACAIDAGILCVEPWGAIVYAYWGVGIEIGKMIPIGGTLQPWQEAVISSPGKAFMFVVTEHSEDRVDEALVTEAARLAQEKAIETCQWYNRWQFPFKATYIFVPAEAP